MTARRLRIGLDLQVDDDSLTGRLTDAAGGVRVFAGWLGLLATIDALVAASPRPSGGGVELASGRPLHRPSGSGRTFWGPRGRCRFLVTGASPTAPTS